MSKNDFCSPQQFQSMAKRSDRLSDIFKTMFTLGGLSFKTIAYISGIAMYGTRMNCIIMTALYQKREYIVKVLI